MNIAPFNSARTRFIRHQLPGLGLALAGASCGRFAHAVDTHRARELYESLDAKTLRRPAQWLPTRNDRSPKPAAVKAIASLQDYFDKTYIQSAESIKQMVESGNSRNYYDMMYVHNAHLSMFEATGDSIYLERTLAWMESQISLATNIDRHGHRNWQVKGVDGVAGHATRLVPHLLYDAQATTEFARLVRIIASNQRLSRKYGARASRVHAFMREDIVNKWLVDRTQVQDTLGWILANADPQLNTRFEIDDKPVMMARILMNLDAAQPDSMAIRVAHLVLTGLKARFKPWSPPGTKGSLVFDQDRISAEFNRALPPDTAHANRHVYAALDGWQSSLVFERDDLIGLSRLFSSVIWNGSDENPQFTNYIDGRNEKFRSLPPWGNGAIFFGWDYFGLFDKNALRATSAMLAAIRKGQRNPSIDYNSSYLGRLSLAASEAVTLLRRDLHA